MCHPGRPNPQDDCQAGSPGSLFIHSAKPDEFVFGDVVNAPISLINANIKVI
jgi:hypothetical protein